MKTGKKEKEKNDEKHNMSPLPSVGKIQQSVQSVLFSQVWQVSLHTTELAIMATAT